MILRTLHIKLTQSCSEILKPPLTVRRKQSRKTALTSFEDCLRVPDAWLQ